MLMSKGETPVPREEVEKYRMTQTAAYSRPYLDEGIDLTSPGLHVVAREAFGEARGMIPTFFRSQVVADLEDEAIWTRSWVCVGFESQIPSAYDLLPFTVGNHGLHVQRQPDGRLTAAFNRAQHGGCRSVPSQCRTGNKTDCHYTSCGYSRDRDVIPGHEAGQNTPEMYQYLGVNPLKLAPARVDTWAGFVFVNLDPNCGSLGDQMARSAAPDSVEADVATRFRHRGRECFDVEANWKLAGSHFLSKAPSSADDATRHWVFPNLLLAVSARRVVSIILQPVSPTAVVQRFDVFTNANATAPAKDEWASVHTLAAAHRRRSVELEAGQACLGSWKNFNVSGRKLDVFREQPLVESIGAWRFQSLYLEAVLRGTPEALRRVS